jgi:hypothetical protein
MVKMKASIIPMISRLVMMKLGIDFLVEVLFGNLFNMINKAGGAIINKNRGFLNTLYIILFKRFIFLYSSAVTVQMSPPLLLSILPTEP